MARNVIWSPQPRQAAFEKRGEYEALYGGAAGGGKSDALVIEALRQVHIPHYRAILIRKTFPQLADLIDKTQNYYRRAFPRAIYNSSNHCWTFPSGAKVYFGSMAAFLMLKSAKVGKLFSILAPLVMGPRVCHWKMARRISAKPSVAIAR